MMTILPPVTGGERMSSFVLRVHRRFACLAFAVAPKLFISGGGERCRSGGLSEGVVSGVCDARLPADQKPRIGVGRNERP